MAGCGAAAGWKCPQPHRFCRCPLLPESGHRYPAAWKPGQEPYYSINDEQNNKLFAGYQELAAKERNVLFGGRLGQYRYYDMDKVVEAALDMAKKEMN